MLSGSPLPHLLLPLHADDTDDADQRFSPLSASITMPIFPQIEQQEQHQQQQEQELEHVVSSPIKHHSDAFFGYTHQQPLSHMAAQPQPQPQPLMQLRKDQRLRSRHENPRVSLSTPNSPPAAPMHAELQYAHQQAHIHAHPQHSYPHHQYPPPSLAHLQQHQSQHHQHQAPLSMRLPNPRLTSSLSHPHSLHALEQQQTHLPHFQRPSSLKTPGFYASSSAVSAPASPTHSRAAAQMQQHAHSSTIAQLPAFHVGSCAPRRTSRVLTSSASTPSLTSLASSSVGIKGKLMPSKKAMSGSERNVKTRRTIEPSSSSHSLHAQEPSHSHTLNVKESRLARKAELARASRKRKKAHISGLEQEVERLSARIAEEEVQVAAQRFQREMEQCAAQVQARCDSDHVHAELPQLNRLKFEQQEALQHPTNRPLADVAESSPFPAHFQQTSSHSIAHSMPCSPNPSNSDDDSTTDSSTGTTDSLLPLMLQHAASSLDASAATVFGSFHHLIERMRASYSPGIEEQFSLFAFAQAPLHLTSSQPLHAATMCSTASALRAALNPASPDHATAIGVFWNSLLRNELGLEDEQVEALKLEREAAIRLGSQLAELEFGTLELEHMLRSHGERMLSYKSMIRAFLMPEACAKLCSHLMENEYLVTQMNEELMIAPIPSPYAPSMIVTPGIKPAKRKKPKQASNSSSTLHKMEEDGSELSDDSDGSDAFD